MVVEGDGGRRLAIECDGDQYHGPERWADDMNRQRILERVGWTFWRCFGSNFSLDREGVLNDLIETLDRMKIKPVGAVPLTRSYTLHRVVPADVDEAGTRATKRRTTEPSDQTGTTEDVQERLMACDRVMIRFIDDERGRPESYILSDKINDPKNGILFFWALPKSCVVDQDMPKSQSGDRPLAVCGRMSCSPPAVAV